jgi:hypothetical protein
MDELKEALAAEGMDIDDLDPDDIFPGLGLSKRFLREQQRARVRLSLVKSMNRGMGLAMVDHGIQDDSDEGTAKAFADYRVYEIMQPMIEKHFGIFFETFEVDHSSVDVGSEGAQSIMARVKVSENDYIHICICKSRSHVAASAWKEVKGSIDERDQGIDTTNSTQIAQHNKKVQKDFFFCSKDQNAVLLTILDSNPIGNNLEAKMLDRSSGIQAQNLIVDDEEVLVNDEHCPYVDDHPPARGYDTAESECEEGYVEHGMFTEMRPFMEKAAGKKFEMFKIKFYRNLIYGTVLTMYLVKIQVSETEHIHAKIHRRSHN